MHYPECNKTGIPPSYMLIAKTIMSNPARAPRLPMTASQTHMSRAPDAYLPEDAQEQFKAMKLKDLESNVMALGGTLRMEPRRSFVIPRELTVDRAVLLAKKPTLATAKTGAPQPRVRSSLAKEATNRVWDKLPEEGLFGRDVVGTAMRTKVMLDAGTEMTIGRILIAYPGRYESSDALKPVSVMEARTALDSCGINLHMLPLAARRPLPLVPKEGEGGILVNPKSDNGFPVLGQWKDQDAQRLVMGLAVTMERELAKCHTYEEVIRWKEQAEQERPELVTLRGKAKADFYTVEKIMKRRMRFYNALPRQVMLNMQKATQVVEYYAQNILDDPLKYHTAIGVTLVRGGAAALVDALELQLREHQCAFVHVGDDSWVIWTDGHEIAMFALDCSNFDLTQHGDVTHAIHTGYRTAMEAVDKRAAWLWYAYMRKRQVAVVGSSIWAWEHAGPSGMPLQSKVNDALMDVMIRRFLARGQDCTKRSKVERDLIEVATSMGFVVKLEQYVCHQARTIKEVLEQMPFLFVGYYFHVRNGQIAVCTDLPRTMAQVPYPSLKWMKTAQEVQVKEAMRVGSIAMGMGIPPVAYEPAFTAFRDYAVEALRAVIDRLGDVHDEDFRWAVQENPFLGEDTEASLSGLLRALQRDPRILWEKEVELLSSSTLVPIGAGSWADQMEQEEESDVERITGKPLLHAAGVRAIQPISVAPHKVPTHPATLKNVGRPPPTAVWGPPRAPRERGAEGVSARTRRRDGIASREFHQALEDLYDEYSSDSDSLL